MDTKYKKTVALKAEPFSIESAEKDYWKSLKTGSVVKLHGPVKSITTSETHYAVPDGFKVLMYSLSSDHLVKSFSCKSAALSCGFRADAQLLVAGDEGGYLRVFSVAKKTVLRNMHTHSGPIYGTSFMDMHIVSGGHDGSVQLWDVTTSQRVARVASPTGERVSCLVASKNTPNLVLVGSFDGVVRLYDIRQESIARTLEHGFPVSSVALSPADNLAFSAGDHWVRAWSLAGSGVGSQLCAYKRHHKLVTSLAVSREGSRLLSAGVDGLVKVANTLDFKEVAKMEFTSPLLSMAISHDSNTLIVGGEDSMLHTRRRRIDVVPGSEAEGQESARSATRREMRAAETKRRLEEMKVTDVPPAEDTLVTEHQRRQFLTRFDRLLRHFRHSAALSEALHLRFRRGAPEVTLAVIRELKRRRVLAPALAGRSEGELNRILRFVRANIYRHGFQAALIEVVNTLIGLYPAENLTSCSEFSKTRHVIQQTAAYLTEAKKVRNQIRLLLEASNV